MTFSRRLLRRLARPAAPWFYPLYASWLGRQTRRLGLSRGVLMLSFDLDYAQDNEAAARLLPLFEKRNLHATWSVIGKWVEQYPALHRDLLALGHELMNHTWSHPDSEPLRPGDPRKFHQISSEEAADEVRKAHEYCQAALGYTMRGFRLPHFRPNAAAAATLLSLGYRYTSNRMAMEAPSGGIPEMIDGLLEIPLAPLPRWPSRTVETYRLFRAPDGLYRDQRQFFADFLELLNATQRYQLATCVYLDPWDVDRLTDPPFEACLDALAAADVEVLTLGQAAERWRDKIA